MRPVPPLKTPRGAGPPLLPLRRTAGLAALSALPATVAPSGVLAPQRVNALSLRTASTTYVSTGANHAAKVQSVTVPSGAVTMTIECMSGGPSGFYAVRQRVPVRQGDVISASAGAPSYADGHYAYGFTGSSVTVNGRVVCQTPAGPRADTALVISDPSGAESYQARRPIAGLSMAAAAPALFVSGSPYDYLPDGGCVAITFEG